MKRFVVDVTTRVTVRIDDTKFTPELMAEFNSCISDFGTDEHAFEQHAKHIARLAAEGFDFAFDKGDFVEGYGYSHNAGLDATVHNQQDIDVVCEGGAA